MSLTVKADFSSLDDLQAKLATARARPHAERAKALDQVIVDVETQARANAESWNIDSTGATARSVARDGTPVTRTVYATTRQAALLEYGTPTTGAPRPWMTGPAETGAERLFEMLSKVGDIW